MASHVSRSSDDKKQRKEGFKKYDEIWIHKKNVNWRFNLKFSKNVTCSPVLLECAALFAFYVHLSPLCDMSRPSQFTWIFSTNSCSAYPQGNSFLTFQQCKILISMSVFWVLSVLETDLEFTCIEEKQSLLWSHVNPQILPVLSPSTDSSSSFSSSATRTV